MSNQKSNFNHWCIVELFGHSRIAGHCTEDNIAGTNMLRVDVPETKAQPAFTKYYGASAIYAINPVDETTARMAVEKIEAAPITVWQGEAFTEKFLSTRPCLAPASDIQNPVFEDDDDDDDDNPISFF